MTTNNSCTRDNFGYNLHTLHDIRKIINALAYGPFGPDDEDMLPTDFTIPDCESIMLRSGSDLTVWLKRDTIIVGDEAKNVFSVDRVKADTWDDIAKFVDALEELEATRARQILSFWQDAGWPIDRLGNLTDRQIMVVDALLDRWSDGSVVDFVQIEKAFDNEDDHVISAIVSKKVQVHLPEDSCVEYIADRLGPYEFTGLEGACIARDVWNTFRGEPEIMDCMVWGLLGRGHIQQLPDWSGWGNPYPYGFIKTELNA